MSSQKNTLLAKSGQFQVDSTPYGVVNLHLGQVSIRVSPRALIHLASVLNTASDNYMSLIAHLQSSHCADISSPPSTKAITKEFLSLTQKGDDKIH